MGSNTVVFSGSPTLLLLAGSQSGQNISYFDNATRRPKLMAQYGQDVILLNDGHNEGNQAGPQWVSLYSTWVSNIRALHPSVPIVCLTQNPTKSPLTPNQTAVRARRGASLMTWARSQAGVYGVDTYPAFTDLAVQINADGLHPTKQGEVGAGLSGQEKWAAYLHQALFQ
jgi:lysophospholipase L1-like esterase